MTPWIAIIRLYTIFFCVGIPTSATENSRLIFRISNILRSQTLNSNQICATNVFATPENYSYDGYHQIESKFPIAILRLKTIPKSYFNREVDDQDIINSLAFGVLRFSINRVCVFIDVRTLSPEIATNSILWKRFGRPALDHFIYFGKAHVINAFVGSQFGEDIRHKYGVMRIAKQIKFVNFCNPRLNYLNPKCDSILNGKLFKASPVAEPSVARYVQSESGKKEYVGGICYRVLRNAALQYNFTFRMNSGGGTGYKDPKDGKWKGVMGDVFNRDSDLGLCTGFSEDRHYIVDPSVSISWYTRIFYVRTPSTRTSWKSVFWPLDKIVWGFLILTLVLIIPSFVINREKNSKRKLIRSILDATDTTFQIVLEQSAHSIHTWRGKRIRSLLVFFTFFSLVIGTGYRSKLVSFLTFLEKEPIPRTHHELSLSGYKIYFRSYNGIAYAAAISSTLPSTQRIMRRAILVNSSRDCILRAGIWDHSACMDYGFPADYSISTNATLYPHRKNEFFIKSKDTSLAVSNIWTFRKGSPLRETFDKIILARLENGLYEKWTQEDWLESKIAGAEWLQKQRNNPIKLKMEQVLRDTSGYPKPLKASSLVGTFGILVVSLGVSAFIFIAEILVKRLGGTTKTKTISLVKSEIARRKRRRRNCTAHEYLVIPVEPKGKCIKKYARA